MVDKNAELLGLVDLILDGLQVGIDAEKDSKIGFEDAALLMRLIPDLGPAFSNVGAVPGELAHLSAEDAASLMTHVMAKLAITNVHARAVIEASLKTATAVYGLLTLLKNPAPVAPLTAA